MADDKTTRQPPFDIRPGERYTDSQGKTWELTDYAQWKMVSTDPTTLGEALPREMARVRDVLMPIYQSIGPAGGFALAMMRRDLDAAAKAMAAADLPAMIKAYQALKDYQE